MTESRNITSAGSLALLAVLASLSGLVGCKDGRPATLQDTWRKLSPPAPAEQVAMAFDPDDADRRREGVVLLSGNSWGLVEPYLAGYAKLLELDSDELVRCVAARALGKAGNTEYAPNLAAALSDASVSVRQDVAAALDEIVADAAIESLQVHALTDASADVRCACAKALRHYRKVEVARTLVQCLGDDSFAVRRQARASLTEIAGGDRGPEPEHWRSVIEDGLPNRPTSKAAP